MITIFTPTYNRCHTLTRLYNSLCRQTCKNFEWLIVDDGSIDDTETLIRKFIPEGFSIRYYKQINGGKHRAINRAVPLAQGDWFFIVDSDDYLSDDAVDVLQKAISDIEGKEDFCAVVANRVFPTNKVIGTSCNYEILDTDFLSYRTKYRFVGDRAEVVRTKVMKEFPFPEISGEKFCPEGIVWNRMAQKYKARYINENIYVCEYMQGGLTDKSALLKKKNPIGYAIYYFEYFNSVSCLKYKFIALGGFWEMYHVIPSGNAMVIPTKKMILLYPIYLLYRVGLFVREFLK